VSKEVPLSGFGEGFLQDFLLRAKLTWRLLRDRRVRLIHKLVPVGTFLYLLFPDLVVGPFDDVAVAWGGTYVFIHWLCPREVVMEHVRALQEEQQDDANEGAPDVIKGNFREK